MKAKEPIDETTSKVLKAYGRPQYTYRTIGGISRDSGLARDIVASVVTRRGDLFEVPQKVAIGGRQLFRLTPRGRSIVSKVRRRRRAALNRRAHTSREHVD